MDIFMTSTDNSTHKDLHVAHHPSIPTQNLNLHSHDQPDSDPDTQQRLRDALSRKQRQLFAARLGHSNIPIKPLDKQIRRLTKILEGCQEACEQGREEAYKETVGMNIEWVVVPVWTCGLDKGDDEARKGCESDRMVVRQEETLPGERVEGELDPEKILGTWI